MKDKLIIDSYWSLIIRKDPWGDSINKLHNLYEPHNATLVDKKDGWIRYVKNCIFDYHHRSLLEEEFLIRYEPARKLTNPR